MRVYIFAPLLLLLLVSACGSFSIQSSFPRRLEPTQRLSLDHDLPPPFPRPDRGVPLLGHEQQQQQPVPPQVDVQIREATADEAAAAQNVLLRHAMNPLFVSATYLLVATTPTTAAPNSEGGDKGRVIGFGQIRPLPSEETSGGDGPAAETTAATSSDPNLASFWWELASLFVDPDYRRRGVGTALIRELLRRHDDRQQLVPEGGDSGGTPAPGTVVLLTLAPTAPLYEPHGFRVVEPSSPHFQNLPRSVRLEHAAGRALSFVLGNRLVCMVRPPPTHP